MRLQFASHRTVALLASANAQINIHTLPLNDASPEAVAQGSVFGLSACAVGAARGVAQRTGHGWLTMNIEGVVANSVLLRFR